jgi:hypothetical protein
MGILKVTIICQSCGHSTGAKLHEAWRSSDGTMEVCASGPAETPFERQVIRIEYNEPIQTPEQVARLAVRRRAQSETAKKAWQRRKAQAQTAKPAKDQ